jgi:hypothetical protein
VGESCFAVQTQSENASCDTDFCVRYLKFSDRQAAKFCDDLRGRQRPIKFMGIWRVTQRDDLLQFLLALKILFQWLERQMEILSGYLLLMRGASIIEPKYSGGLERASRK